MADILQVIPIGRKGFLLLYPDHVMPEVRETFPQIWRDNFPGTKAMLIEYARLNPLTDGTPMFEFTGPVSEQLIKDFRLFWDQSHDGLRSAIEKRIPICEATGHGLPDHCSDHGDIPRNMSIRSHIEADHDLSYEQWRWLRDFVDGEED